jgi:hypothetical protein
MAKTVATDSAKEGVNGAVQGAMSGKIVEGGASGAVDGAKTSNINVKSDYGMGGSCTTASSRLGQGSC